MLPLLPFLAGIAVGVLGVSAARSGRASQVLHQVSDQLREVAHTGSEQLRGAIQAGEAWTRGVWERVAPATDPDAAAPTQARPPASSTEPTPAADAKPRTRRSSKRSTAASAKKAST